MRRRHRHGPYQSTPYTRGPRLILRPIIGLLVVAGLLFFGGRWILGSLHFGGPNQQTASVVTLEDGGTVRVSLDGGEWKTAEQGLKLFPGDRISTAANAAAKVEFFDGSRIRIDGDGDLRITESATGNDAAVLSLQLERGNVWMTTPSGSSFTGAIARTLATTFYTATIPSGAELFASGQQMSIFAAEGIGSTINVAGAPSPLVLGEGQLLSLPDPSLIASTEDLYTYRSPLSADLTGSSFVEESRAQVGSNPTEPSESSNGTDALPSLLTVSAPLNAAVLTSSTVVVEGTVSNEVASIMVNGYAARADDNGDFTLELTLPDKDAVTIVIEAFDTNGEVLAEVRRKVERDRSPPASPHFLRPAKDGETYQTQQSRIEIVGEAPPDAVGIIINDYRLQFFEPGDTTWTYLADTQFDNFRQGENIFEAVAIREGGLKSEPVNMTVILGGQTEGVIASSEKAEDSGEAEEANDEEPPVALTDNDPLAPGTLKVTGPGEGTTYYATETEFLIEGVASPGSQSIWVNDYRLRLFQPEKGLWNYIASTELGTMKRGTNTYTITARNADGQVLDRLTYTVEFDPMGRNDR